MNRKLIFFDIDGTIIPEDTGVIPESTKEAIKKAKENVPTNIFSPNWTM